MRHAGEMCVQDIADSPKDDISPPSPHQLRDPQTQLSVKSRRKVKPLFTAPLTRMSSIYPLAGLDQLKSKTSPGGSAAFTVMKYPSVIPIGLTKLPITVR